MRRTLIAVLASCALLAALAAPAGAHSSGDGSGGVDTTKLPVGSTPVSIAMAGKVFSCQTSFPSNVPGAFATGSWFNSDSTWDLTKKPTVDGSVSWPQANITITTSGTKRVVSGNGLPTKETTGTFPVASTDDAYNYDRNPNTISAQTVSISLPKSPKVAATSTCLGLGTIGVLVNGVQLFNALDAGGRDAAAYEIQDSCQGHPEQGGTYHYHSISSCVLDRLDAGSGHSKLVGYATDGFGIYGPRGTNGKNVTDADLDACHGHTHTVKFNGKMVKVYHYHATAEYPYTIGCYKGTPVSSHTGNAAGTQPSGSSQTAGGPPAGGPPAGDPPAGGPPAGGPPPGAPG